MTDCTVAAPTRATKAPARPKAAPSPAPTQPPLNEGDKLALEAGEVLQGMVWHVLYPSPASPRLLINNLHLDEADHLLSRLLSPDDHERDPSDPEEGNVLDHLACISSELEAAAEVLKLCDLNDYSPGEQAIFTVVINHAAEFADRLFLAYKNLPGTLEELRALSTQAGARQFRDRPTPPIRRVEDDAEYQGLCKLTRNQLIQVLEVAASNLAILDQLLMSAQAEKDDHACALFIDAAQALVSHCGGMVDSAAGGAILGGHDRWNFGPNFHKADAA